jgi:hypothetical protein
MAEAKQKCIVCAKDVAVLKGGICEPCQDRIRREALGEQRASTTAPIRNCRDMELLQRRKRACDEGNRRAEFLGSSASANQLQPDGG